MKAIRFLADTKLFNVSARAVWLGSILMSGVTLNSAGAGTSGSLMDITADGRLLACSNRDSGSVTIVDLQTHKKLREIPVGRHPEGLSFLGQSRLLAIALYADDRVLFIDAETGQTAGATEVFDEPYGVVSLPDGSAVYVTLEYPAQVVRIDASTKQVSAAWPVGPFPRGLAYSAETGRLFVTEYYTGAVQAVDTRTGREVDRWEGASSDNLARQIVLHPRRPKAYVPHIRSRVTAVHGAGSIFPYVAVIDTAGEARRRKRIPMDSFDGTRVTSNPWEIDISPDGRKLYVVFSGTDDLFACDIVDDDYTEIALYDYLEVGRNPRAVRVAPDGKTVYVYNALDFEVVAYETERHRKVAAIPVTDNPLGEEHLRGKTLFYSARQPMVGRRWISCSSCHPDGDPDGRTWHNPEGLRNTQALFGLAWTHPLHWSADRDEVQDFEHTIRGPLMQGRGLVADAVHESLGAPNRGLSDDLDALAVYTNSHGYSLSPHARRGLSDAAIRGREIFESNQTGCAECHRGPFYTDSIPGRELVRHDVGTGDDDQTEKMGPAYDTPTLLGVYRTAPYLHHGKADTLEDVLTTLNPGDRHGTTSHLSPRQISDLVQFLKSLPYDDPVPQAKSAGLLKIDR